MSQIAPLQQRMADVSNLLTKQKKAFARGLPSFMARNADQFIRVALTTIKRNPRIAECSADSLLGSLQMAAQLGMMPDGILGHAYLVPRRNRGNWECNLQLGYQGLLQLAYRSGDIKSVQVDIVYEADTFERRGHHKIIRHIPCEEGERGGIRFAYAIVETQGGGEISWCVDKADVAKARKSSQTDKVWTAHPEAMWMKTALRRVLKYAPCSTDLQRAVNLDEIGEAGISQGLAEEIKPADFDDVTVPQDEPEEAPAKSKPTTKTSPATDPNAPDLREQICEVLFDRKFSPPQIDAICMALGKAKPVDLTDEAAVSVLSQVKTMSPDELNVLLPNPAAKK